MWKKGEIKLSNYLIVSTLGLCIKFLQGGILLHTVTVGFDRDTSSGGQFEHLELYTGLVDDPGPFRSIEIAAEA